MDRLFPQFNKGFGLEIPKALVTIPSHGGIVNLPAVIITLILAWMLSRGTRKVNESIIQWY